MVHEQEWLKMKMGRESRRRREVVAVMVVVT
jgi:hypothetical protein